MAGLPVRPVNVISGRKLTVNEGNEGRKRKRITEINTSLCVKSSTRQRFEFTIIVLK